MDTKSPEHHPQLVERQLQIESITHNDRQAFREWIAANPDQPRLDLNPKAARYFIPKPLFELVDPGNIQVRIAHANKNELELFVVEEMSTTISNPDSLSQYAKDLERFERSDHKIPKPQPPSDIDPMHALYIKDLQASGITSRDKILLAVSFEQFKNDELFVRNYDDRKELRGKGVATSAYERMSEIGLALHERYITGRNRNTPDNPKRIDFFLEKLGRKRFSNLDGALKAELYERHLLRDDQLAEQFTISFLHPEEKAKAYPINTNGGRILMALTSLIHHPKISKPSNSNTQR